MEQIRLNKFANQAEEDKKKIIEGDEKRTQGNAKDYNLTIFHALGKLLYNKRLDGV